MSNLKIDQIFACVNKIVENLQCPICDKADGCQMRYSCGHTACKTCVNDYEDCQICMIVPQTTSSSPKLDETQTQRVKHASELLKACQDLFHTDGLSHKRLSEQLRVEKELFPQCIQAPFKYENKRRSSIISNNPRKKRSVSYFPGEGIDSKENIMDHSINYVQQWLHKNDNDLIRKPFRDINVNSPSHSYFNNNKKRTVHIRNDENTFQKKNNKKRSHSKTIHKGFTPLGDTFNQDQCIKRIKKESEKSYHVKNTNKKCDESGIFMENDDIIEIDDSQEVIDKDKNAWLAVLDAHKNETVSTSYNVASTDKSLCHEQIPNKSTNLNEVIKTPVSKVPFYKKGYLTETCIYCNNMLANKPFQHSKEVNISIDNNSFTTSIKIMRYTKDSVGFNKIKSSISTQTDISEIKEILKSHQGNKVDEFLNFEPKCTYTQSVDLFAGEGKTTTDKYETNNVGLIIEESDSEVELDESGPVPVQVDVHRSCEESSYGILDEIENVEERDNNPRRGPRGHTPTSTDSSEKENYNPNRIKKIESKKKKYIKK